MLPSISKETLQIGDPVPWFEAESLAGARVNLGVVAGRYVVLAFLNDLAQPTSSLSLSEMLSSAGLFKDDHLVFYGVLSKPPESQVSIDLLKQVSRPALGFLMDYTGAIGKAFQADERPKVFVLDPMLKIRHQIELGSIEAMRDLSRLLRDLPSVDDFAGVPLSAPALSVPGVFEPQFCRHLIELYDSVGGIESGFMLDQNGKTTTVVNHFLKSRRDFVVVDQGLRDAIRTRMVKRLIPAIERFFQFRPTRMDRYLVSCYAADAGGHFFRHRDNVNAGARHRRFAVSMNLNLDFEGCDLIFPEFGRRRLRAPLGGAIVFATGALHEVTPITRGKRYAFVPFLYGEEDAKKRFENNQFLAPGESLYRGDMDALFVNEA